MANITIDDNGLAAKLKRVDAEFERKLEAAMRTATTHVNTVVSDYTTTKPPKLPNQKYKRTFRLKNSWGVREIEPYRGVAASQGVKYAPYVMDKERQAGIHAGRWWTTDRVAKEQGKTVTKL